MNKRDFLKILPGVFSFTSVSGSENRYGDLKYLDFYTESISFSKRGFKLKDSINSLEVEVLRGKSGQIIEANGILNGQPIKIEFFEFRPLDPKDVKLYGTYRRERIPRESKVYSEMRYREIQSPN